MLKSITQKQLDRLKQFLQSQEPLIVAVKPAKSLTASTAIHESKPADYLTALLQILNDEKILSAVFGSAEVNKELQSNTGIINSKELLEIRSAFQKGQLVVSKIIKTEKAEEITLQDITALQMVIYCSGTLTMMLASLNKQETGQLFTMGKSQSKIPGLEKFKAKLKECIDPPVLSV